MSIVSKIVKSWSATEGVATTEEIIEWVNEFNKNTYVSIHEICIGDDSFWYYDEASGVILNKNKTFFSIKGIKRKEENVVVEQQPIIIQDEIGYLGIICKEINGVLHFLMQAKIEPGNINCVQISPTIQATKSNFTRAHGGNLPTYFDVFRNAYKYDVIYDQVQSEQASRFYKKRNRNIIVLIEEEIDIFPNYKWMTLGQIKQLMDIENLVNMDTRTVLSGLPLIIFDILEADKYSLKSFFRDKSLFHSIFDTFCKDNVKTIFNMLNNYKMYNNADTELVPLSALEDWSVDESGLICKHSANFMVRYYEIEIHGREVQKWTQPLFKAIGMATFGLIAKNEKGIKKFLVKIKPEIGSFDLVELGPTIQWEPIHSDDFDVVEELFLKKVKAKDGILNNVILSEEGGRFYHEQNKNIIVEIQEFELMNIPSEYIWVDYATLNFMIQINNCVNIQLRNLLSLIKI